MVQTPEWVHSFEKCRKNWHNEDPDSTQPPLSLATVDSEGKARVRMVGHAALGYQSQYGFWTILIGTDARTPKTDQIRENPDVELAYWFQRDREQFRVSGKAFIVDRDSSDAVWLNERRKIFDSLKDIRKEHYGKKEAPGTPLGHQVGSPLEDDPDAFLKAEAAALAHYALIVIRVETCDWLSQPAGLRKRFDFDSMADEDEEQWHTEELQI